MMQIFYIDGVDILPKWNFLTAKRLNTYLESNILILSPHLIIPSYAFAYWF